ncbi:ParB N-terminal domain-containing protein [Streptomyces sp. DSM 42041]|uniref:ParB N-terminal domain-containing protein n=1 Tax=Streptomyces hazeniae TaxID=3075538 RepID=A0ABU2NJU7_9ACTN|nr:ParB N-terminal domain-containing protein [Streptomyces sp. DSM 42041]MDT0377247.1 ParB N-terminal domain-containing protein [Streptomyces sp. DSM 42041]
MDQATATYVTTRDVPLDELTPFPGNAKIGDVDTIRRSLRRNGQYRSLVVREISNGPLIVLAGNHTMQALQADGQTTARCEIVQCDDATARRINLVDNRSAELGSYDHDALAQLLTDAADDLDGTGYTPEQVDDITALLALPPEEPAQLAAAHGDPDDDAFHPKIQLTVTPGTFDRWRVALDAHEGRNDEEKLDRLLDEIEQHRNEPA